MRGLLKRNSSRNTNQAQPHVGAGPEHRGSSHRSQRSQYKASEQAPTPHNHVSPRSQDEFDDKRYIVRSRAFDEGSITVPVSPDGRIHPQQSHRPAATRQSHPYASSMPSSRQPSQQQRSSLYQPPPLRRAASAQRPSRHHDDNDSLRVLGAVERQRSRSQERASPSSHYRREYELNRYRNDEDDQEVRMLDNYNPHRSTDHHRNSSRQRASQHIAHGGDDNSSADAGDHASGDQNSKRRIRKSEKIQHLQAKNELYKEEFKRVQRDRKQLKKDLQSKREEVAALQQEMDGRIAEISVLKTKLSETMQSMDRNDDSVRRDRSVLAKLAHELDDTKRALAAARSRLADLKEETEAMREQFRRKDQQIESLTAEVADQSKKIDVLEEEKGKRLWNAKQDAKDELHELKDENASLKKELGTTLERAAQMVKEREDAIADLLKESDQLKQLADHASHASEGAGRDAADDNRISEEEFLQLREELDTANYNVEVAQDRVRRLEQEVEAWVSRGHEMEEEIDSLKLEVESWQSKAQTAEQSVTMAQQAARKTERQVAEAQDALAEARAHHGAHLAELEIKHRAAILDAREKARAEAIEHYEALSVADSTTVDSSSEKGGSSRDGASNRRNMQDKMLLDALAKKQKKEEHDAAAKGGWLSRFGKNGEEEALTEEQKRVKELEVLNEEQAAEIARLKSEMVRVRSTYNETMYTNKKMVEQLEHENTAYTLKVKALERKLAGANVELEPTETEESESTSV